VYFLFFFFSDGGKVLKIVMVEKKMGAIVTCLILAIQILSAGGSKESAPEIAPVALVASAPSRLFEWTGSEGYRSPMDSRIEKANLVNQAQGLEEGWERDSSFYHIWVKSFSDYDGDGIGDFRGITAKLDYIKNEVGCDAIWLSPIFDCAGKGTTADYNMHGYDTVDYYNVNDYFGNMEHLEELLRQAHARGMKVIFDFVPNHTSNLHPWFLQSAKRESGKDDWYLWNNEKLSWNAMGNGNTWYSNYDRQQFYYGAFWSGMPDLNFRNREVREEMKNVVRFWLNKGFDGLRIDAVRYLVEEDGAKAGLVDTEATHDWFEELRAEVVDAYAELGSPKFMICEAWVNNDRTRLDRYYGTAEVPEFNMVFDFDFAGKLTMAAKYRNPEFFSFLEKQLFNPGNPVRYATFLSNHDNVSNRPASVYKTPQELRLASAMPLLLPATPFIYYGNEIGQEDQPGLSGQDLRLRYPFDWKKAEAQLSDSNSLLAMHRTLLGLRAAHPALRIGSYTSVPVQASDVKTAYAYLLRSGGDAVLCVFNLGLDAVPSLAIDSGKIAGFDMPRTADLLYASSASVVHSLTDGTLTLSGMDSRDFAVFGLKLVLERILY